MSSPLEPDLAASTSSTAPFEPVATSPILEFSATELLADADRRARQLLGRDGAADGASLLAGWPGLLDAASDVLAAGKPASPPGPARVLVERLAAEATAVGSPRIVTSSFRPRDPRPPHPALARIIATWAQAAALLNRPDQSSSPSRSAADLAVDQRVMRTLATVAHATQLGLTNLTGRPAVMDSGELKASSRMTQRNEQRTLQCLRELTSAPPHPVGNRRPSTDEPAASQVAAPDRLAAGLKAWAPTAIDTAADPSSAARDIYRIAQIETLTVRAAGALVAAAGQRGELPSESVPHLQRRFEELTRQWQQVAGQWHWIRRYGAAQPSPTVLRTSRELAGAAAAAVHTAARGPHQPQPHQEAAREVAARFADTDIVPIMRTIAQDSVILAEIYQRLPAHTHRRESSSGRLQPTLYAPAQILRQLSEHQFGLRHPDATHSPAVLDVPLTGRGVHPKPMTDPALGILRIAGADLGRAATTAEKALDVAAGTSPQRTSGGLASRYAPSTPRPPSQLSPGITPGMAPGTTPGRGIPR